LDGLRLYRQVLVVPLIVLETLIAAPPERCFDLSVDVDVHQASVSWSRERAVAGVMTGRMHLGDQVTWEARHFLRTWRMTSRITECERPARFVDEMVVGPFAAFRHEHLFQARDAGTWMGDRVDYRSPLGLLGVLADAAVLKRYLRSLLLARNRYIKATAERL
jgi:ligand-binding SRPBCC domain-containing protein